MKRPTCLVVVILVCGMASGAWAGAEEEIARLRAASNQTLAWPKEVPLDLSPRDTRFEAPQANYLLDLHGNPQTADLVIFMAGNQYMVLPELVRAYMRYNPKVRQVFYVTTPPGVLLNAMDSKRLVLGNFWLDLNQTWPDVFLTGLGQQRVLTQKNYARGYYVYAKMRGVVLLVRKGNPLGITSARDLARPEVRVAIPSPQREPDAFGIYGPVIANQAGQETLKAILARPSTLHPVGVHHREIPQMIFDGRADVAPMFFHFGPYLTAAFPETFEFVRLPDSGNVSGELGMTVVNGGHNREAAERWLEFMRTNEARRIYEEHGFTYATRAELNTLIVPK